MKRSFGVLATLVVAAACSNNKPAESAYDTTTAGTTAQARDEDGFVPASSTEPSNAPTDGRMHDDPATHDGATHDHATHERKDATRTDAARNDTPALDTIPPPAAGSATDKRTSDAAQPDNTKVNKRDADGNAVTPIDQGNNESDLKITQRIRQSVMSDGSLSFTAKNVKIITNGGKVTLRGPVKSAAERASIDAAARKVAGPGKVDNQLEVVQ